MQRFQSICLFIVSILAASSLFVPFKSINVKTNADVLNNYFIMKWLLIAVAVLSLVNIFLFINRTLQLKFVLVIMLLVILSAAMIYNYKEAAVIDQLTFHSYIFAFPIVEFICLILAYFGIYKDHKLVTDSDRLR